MDRHTLAQALARAVPGLEVVATPEALRPFESDGLTALRQLPLVAVLPDRVEQVQAVLRFCLEAKIPVVARGAGTGLSGGALPCEAGVLLVLAKLNRILEINPTRQCARLQPGVRNLAISEAAAPHGLFYAPDPSSQIACSIGGNVAENAGGVHCLKYGLTVHNLLAVTMVTVEGDLLTLGGPTLEAPGLDLLALFTGSEGLLGVVVEVTVRLRPIPAQQEVLLAAFDSIRASGDAVAAVIAAGIIPAGMELMDKLAVQAAEDFVHAGYPRDAAAVLLCELDGAPAVLAETRERVMAVLRAAGASSITVSDSDEARLRLWSGRKNAFPAVGRLAPDYYCMDGTIPRRYLGEVLDAIAARSEAAGLPVANVFHAGDGNLHPLILYDANTPDGVARAEALGNEILALCVAYGGSVTGEHGVGVEKLDAMCSQFAPPELARFKALKAAFDPEGLLNPGKAVPTLARCAELGGMHVHHGQLPHPELPRL